MTQQNAGNFCPRCGGKNFFMSSGVIPDRGRRVECIGKCADDGYRIVGWLQRGKIIWENAELFFKSRLADWIFDKHLRRQARRMARAEGKQMSKENAEPFLSSGLLDGLFHIKHAKGDGFGICGKRTFFALHTRKPGEAVPCHELCPVCREKYSQMVEDAEPGPGRTKHIKTKYADCFPCDICGQHVIPQHRFVRNSDLKQGHLLCLANVKYVGYPS